MSRLVNLLLIDFGYFAERGIRLDFGQFIPLWLEAEGLTAEARRMGIGDAEDVPLISE